MNMAQEEVFAGLLDQLLIDIDTIDGNTPWQEVEPGWWLQMMAIRRDAQKVRDGYDND